MARGRFLNSSIADDVALNGLSLEAQWLYMMTIPHLDRDGLIKADTYVLFGKVCPRRPELIARVDGFIKEWVAAELVIVYPTRDGRVAFFKGFHKNQQGMHYSREGASTLEPPPGYVRLATGIEPCQGDDDGSGTSGEKPSQDKLPTNSGQTPAEVKYEVKDQDQDQEGDRARQPYVVQPKPGEYLPGLPPPRQRRSQYQADHMASQRNKLGITAAELTALTDTVLGRMNALEIAALDTDIGNDEHRLAQEATLALVALGHKLPESIAAIFDSWFELDWRGQKGDSPTYQQLVEYAKGMQKRVDTRSSATPKLSDAERSKIITRAKNAQANLRTAQQFNGYIDPKWQQDIEAARRLGL